VGAAVLIGAHVSPAGGLPKAIERGVERGCRAIQIFNQSPRMWRPTVYRDEDVSAFREGMAESPIDAVLIHAVYLLNCASDDPDIRSKSLASLTHSLRVGHSIGALGVVLHPGSAKTGDVSVAIARAGETIREALAESEGCELHLENTAGAGGTLGRSFEELASLLEAAVGTGASGEGGSDREKRLGVCLDSCHLLASGYDIRTASSMASVLRESSRKLGRGRIRSLHLNDSQTPLGSNRDRHANLGEGELGEKGCMAFLSSSGLQRLPCVLETPGENREGPSRAEVEYAMTLHERGLQAGKGGSAGGPTTKRGRAKAK
jgi:deoxyribonuclease IV